MVQLQLRPHKITRFRCDNGNGEYNDAVFRSILQGYGITFEPSPPYSQHNGGVCERMIQTVNTKARAILLESQLPSNLWAEAINTANYLHTPSPPSCIYVALDAWRIEPYLWSVCRGSLDHWPRHFS